MSTETFRKWSDEFIGGLNEYYWLAVDVSKLGQGSTKRYVNSCCAVRVIDEQCEAIGRLHQTIQTYNKVINIISTTIGGMGQDLNNLGKEIEY